MNGTGTGKRRNDIAHLRVCLLHLCSPARPKHIRNPPSSSASCRGFHSYQVARSVYRPTAWLSNCDPDARLKPSSFLERNLIGEMLDSVKQFLLGVDASRNTFGMARHPIPCTTIATSVPTFRADIALSTKHPLKYKGLFQTGMVFSRSKNAACLGCICI